MQRTSTYGVVADLAKSRGAYVRDTVTDRFVLDLHGCYSSLPLGYNHPAFTRDAFREAVIAHAGTKMAMCEMTSGPAERARDALLQSVSPLGLTAIHTCASGALAVEAAVKAAVDVTGAGEHARLVTLRESFHGIYGLGGALTDPDGPAAHRMAGLPFCRLAVRIEAPIDGDLETSEGVLACVREAIEHHGPRLAAVIAEPIQCTAGDRVLDGRCLRAIAAVCRERGMAFILDEVQTGFGATGAMWRAEQIGVRPDILVFGKRAQVAGIAASPAFAEAFGRAYRFEATFDGDAIDLLRSHAVLDAYAADDLLVNARDRGTQFVEGLRSLGLAARGVGVLIAVDFPDGVTRNRFLTGMWRDEAVMMVPTGAHTVRLRPPLSIDGETVDLAIAAAGRQARRAAA